MSIKTAERAELREYLATAKAIAWDTCHKIYVLMDDEQVALMREYGYGDGNAPDSLITSEEMTPKKMSATITKWFDSSCMLRFISAVRTTPSDPNEGFTEIIPQKF